VATQHRNALLLTLLRLPDTATRGSSHFCGHPTQQRMAPHASVATRHSNAWLLTHTWTLPIPIRTWQYAQERQQFGAPIGALQATQFKLADMAVTLQASRLMVYEAARELDAKVGQVGEREGLLTVMDRSGGRIFRGAPRW